MNDKTLDAISEILATFFEGYTDALKEVAPEDAEAFIGTTMKVILESAVAAYVYGDATHETDLYIAQLSAMVATDLCRFEQDEYEEYYKGDK